MVLADDNFTSIVAAIKEGRRVWDNIVRLLLFNLPCNIAQGISGEGGCVRSACGLRADCPHGRLHASFLHAGLALHTCAHLDMRARALEQRLSRAEVGPGGNHAAQRTDAAPQLGGMLAFDGKHRPLSPRPQWCGRISWASQMRPSPCYRCARGGRTKLACHAVRKRRPRSRALPASGRHRERPARLPRPTCRCTPPAPAPNDAQARVAGPPIRATTTTPAPAFPPTPPCLPRSCWSTWSPPPRWAWPWRRSPRSLTSWTARPAPQTSDSSVRPRAARRGLCNAAPPACAGGRVSCRAARRPHSGAAPFAHAAAHAPHILPPPPTARRQAGAVAHGVCVPRDRRPRAGLLLLG